MKVCLDIGDYYLSLKQTLKCSTLSLFSVFHVLKCNHLLNKYIGILVQVDHYLEKLCKNLDPMMEKDNDFSQRFCGELHMHCPCTLGQGAYDFQFILGKLT